MLGANMKVRVSTIVYYIFILLLFINLGINYAVGIGFDTRYVRLFTATLGLGVTIFLTLFEGYRNSVSRGKFQFIFACYLFLFISIELFSTINRYDQTLFWTYYELCTIVMSVWFYPLFYVLESERVSFLTILEVITTLTIISYLLRVLSHVSMLLTGNYFMQGLVFEYGKPGIRNGFYRIQQPCLSSIFMPIAIYLFFVIESKTKKMWYLFGVVIAIVFTFSINQSRSIMIYQIIIVVSMFLFKNRTPGKKLLVWYVVIIGVIALSQSPVMKIISEFLYTFNSNSEYGKSTIIRIDTLNYYMQLFRDNLVVGMGALNIGTNGAFSILRGTNGTAYLDDIGLLATVIRYGLLGILLHIIVFGNAVYTIIKFPNTESDFGQKVDKLLLVHLLLSVLMWGINIDCYFQAVSFGMPIFIAIFEYYKFISLNKQAVMH